MFPEVSGNIAVVDDNNREAARRLVSQEMTLLGLSRARLAAVAKIDPKTLRSFFIGERWPQSDTRSAISTALGWPADEIDHSELSAAPDELPAAAKEGLIEEPGEFNT